MGFGCLLWKDSELLIPRPCTYCLLRIWPVSPPRHTHSPSAWAPPVNVCVLLECSRAPPGSLIPTASYGHTLSSLPVHRNFLGAPLVRPSLLAVRESLPPGTLLGQALSDGPFSGGTCEIPSWAMNHNKPFPVPILVPAPGPPQTKLCSHQNYPTPTPTSTSGCFQPSF